jgi:hypothetical protein
MVSHNEEIMITLGMVDKASRVAQGAASTIQSTFSNLSSAANNFGLVTENVMSSLTGKSAMDNIFGTSSKAETNKVLLNNMTETKKGAEELYSTVDKVTDSSLTSMQELIPAMKAFKSATGASDKEMMNITDDMANFGAAVLAQTGSTDLAQGAMMDLSKGIGGAFAALDQYGITQESLKATGYWSGEEDDVEGFMKAVTKVTGSTKELMETNQGLDALIGKSFSRAGKKIGNEYLPQIKDLKRAFLDMDEGMGGGLSASILMVSGALEVANTGFTNVSAIVRGLEDLGSALSFAKGIFKGADAVTDAVNGASAIGGLAGEAGAAAAGAEATAAATTTLSGAFTSMIVPLLALSAVIAIMIPIAAGLAAEAMFFLKLLADFMKAMNFDSVNLDGAAKGLQSLTMALLWVGAAMLALTAVNIATSIATVTSFFSGLLTPLSDAVDALYEASGYLETFNTVHIDESVATNLKTISDSLMSVSSAMLALTGTNITTGFSDFVAWALGFGSVTDGLEQAKNDIISAASKLNEFSGMTPLDTSVATNIQNVCDSLASVGNAMSALRSIRDGQNWDAVFGELMEGIFGQGVDIQTALTNVKQDIIDASAALAQFTDITDIPDGVADKIKKVSDTLTSVNDAFQTLRGLRDDSNWDEWMNGLFGGIDIASALEKIKTDLMTASQKLAALSELSDVNDDVTTKIQQVSDALTKVSEVSTTLVNLSGSGIGEFDSSIITTAITNVQTVANELSRLNETTFDGGSADTLLGSLQTTLDNVKNTLSAASGFSEPAINIGSQIVSGVQSGLSPLSSTVQGAVSSAITSASGQATSGGNTLGKNTTDGMKSTLQLKSTMETEVGYALSAMTSRTQEFYNAGAALGRAASEGFESQRGMDVGSPGKIARTMAGEMGYTLDAIRSQFNAAYNMAAGLGQSIFNGFGNPALDLDMLTNSGQLTAEHVGALKTTVSNAPDKTDGRSIMIIVNEGAVSVDARNKTEREAQSIMTLALESMDHITNIDMDV